MIATDVRSGWRKPNASAQMPPVNTGLLDGELAWRQHDGGHEDRSNLKYFIEWASRLLKHPLPEENSNPKK